MRVNTKPRRRNSPRIAEKSAPQFLQWLRGRECVFSALGACEGKMEAMHLDFAGGKGMGTKVADSYAVPCCSGHHREQHNRGWTTFLNGYELSQELMLEAASFAWSRWPGRIAWERKLEQ